MLRARRSALVGLVAFLSGCGANLVFHISHQRLGDRLNLFLGGGGNSTVLIDGRREALVVDVKWGNFGRILRREIESDLSSQVSRILLTHAHDDHAGGLPLYPGAGVVLAHPKARRRLEALGVHAPFVDVDGELRLFLEGEEVRVLSIGGGHTDGDLVALLPAQRLLIAGDLINNGLEPYSDSAFGGDILEMTRTLCGRMSLEFDRLVPGHGTVMTRGEAQNISDYLLAMERQVRSAQEAGKAEDEVVSAVTLPEYPLRETPFVASRAGNVRAMFRAIARSAKSGSLSPPVRERSAPAVEPVVNPAQQRPQ